MFEKKSEPASYYLLALIGYLILGIWMTNDFTLPEESFVFFAVESIISLIILVAFIATSISLYDKIKNGFNNETYKGYYFKDKIVFYRISKHMDEIYTKGLRKEQILAEIIKLKDQIAAFEKQKINAPLEFAPSLEYSDCKFHLENYEKGLTIADNLQKPHKIEMYFKEIKYFINEDDYVKAVGLSIYEEDGNDKYFHNQLKLSKEYKNYKAEVVDFLNKQVEYNKSINRVDSNE